MEEIHPIELPQDDLKNRWYTPSEYYLFRRDATRAVVQRQRTKGCEDDNMTCYTALDMVDTHALKERELLVKKARDTVFRAQDGQYTCNRLENSMNSSASSEDEVIAQKYHQISCETEKKALKTALKNAKEAMEYLGKPKKLAGKQRGRWGMDFEHLTKGIEQQTQLFTEYFHIMK